jgi:hypothetical protein
MKDAMQALRTSHKSKQTPTNPLWSITFVGGLDYAANEGWKD